MLLSIMMSSKDLTLSQRSIKKLTVSDIHCFCERLSLDLRVGSIKSTQVNLGLPSRVKSVCSSVTVEIFWRRRFHYKSFQVDLRSRLYQKSSTLVVLLNVVIDELGQIR